MKRTRKAYEEWLNEFSVPDHDKRSNGGRIPDFCKYGAWLRRNDPIAFNIGYREWIDNKTRQGQPKTPHLYYQTRSNQL